MYTISIRLEFCYGHRLLRYAGKCRHLHGHNGTVDIELSADTLDRRQMVRDFSEIKHAVAAWIDAHLDHKMILSKGDPALPALRKLGEPLYVMDANPTAEALAKLLYDVAKRTLRLPVTAVKLWETPRACATYAPR